MTRKGSPDRGPFGNWLDYRLSRRRPAISQFELARITGLSPSLISGWLNGARNPSGDFKLPSTRAARAVASAINTEPNRLADDIDEALLCSGKAPDQPGIVIWHPDGSCSISRPEGGFVTHRTPTDLDDLRELAERQQQQLTAMREAIEKIVKSTTN